MKAIATNLCNNFISRSLEDGVPVTPMKLQRLMYFLCRDYLHRTGECPINERFEVWQYGPVLPSLQGQFAAFGSNPIDRFAQDALGNAKKASESKNPILAEILEVVWAKYRRYTGRQLSELTHQRGSGWYRAYMDARTFISAEDMAADHVEMFSQGSAA